MGEFTLETMVVEHFIKVHMPVQPDPLPESVPFISAKLVVTRRSEDGWTTPTCSDTVFHPTMPWPWLGEIRQEVMLRPCTECGELKIPGKWRKDPNLQVSLFWFVS